MPLSFVMFDLMVALSTLLFAISGNVELFDTFDAFISSEVSTFEHSDVSFAFDASAANSGVENEDGILLLLLLLLLLLVGELDILRIYFVLFFLSNKLIVCSFLCCVIDLKSTCFLFRFDKRIHSATNCDFIVKL